MCVRWCVCVDVCVLNCACYCVYCCVWQRYDALLGQLDALGLNLSKASSSQPDNNTSSSRHPRAEPSRTEPSVSSLSSSASSVVSKEHKHSARGGKGGGGGKGGAHKGGPTQETSLASLEHLIKSLQVSPPRILRHA